MAEIPYGQYYKCGDELFARDCACEKVFRYLFNEYLIRLRRNNTEPFHVSAYSTAIFTGVDRHTVSKALKKLADDYRLIALKDEKCEVYGSYFKAVIDLFTHSNKKQRGEVREAFQTHNIGALQEMGLDMIVDMSAEANRLAQGNMKILDQTEEGMVKSCHSMVKLNHSMVKDYHSENPEDENMVKLNHSMVKDYHSESPESPDMVKSYHTMVKDYHTMVEDRRNLWYVDANTGRNLPQEILEIFAKATNPGDAMEAIHRKYGSELPYSTDDLGMKIQGLLMNCDNSDSDAEMEKLAQLSYRLGLNIGLENMVKLYHSYGKTLPQLWLNFTNSKRNKEEGRYLSKGEAFIVRGENVENVDENPVPVEELPAFFEKEKIDPMLVWLVERVKGLEKDLRGLEGLERIRKEFEEVKKGLERVRDLFLDFSPSHPLQKLPAPSEKESDPSDTELPADDKEGEDKPDIFARFKKLPDVDFTFGKGSEEQEGEEGEELPADREEESQAHEAFQPTEEELREETRRDAEYVRSRSPYKNKPYLERSVIKECVTGLGERIDYATDLFVHIFVRYAWEAWYDMVGPEHEDPSEPSEGAASQEDAFKKKIPTADDFLRMDGMELPLETAMQCARNAYDDLLGWNSQRAYIGPDGKRRPFSPDLPETEAEELEWMYACDFEVRTDRDRTKHVTIDFGRFRDVLAADVREDVPSRGKDKALRKRENAAYRDLLLAEGAKPESPLEAMQLGFYRTFCGLGLENRVDAFHDAKGYELIPGTKFPEHLLRPWCARREYDANYKDFTSSLWKPYSGLDGISRGPFLFDARKTARWSELRGHSDGLAAKAIEAAAGMPKEEWEE